MIDFPIVDTHVHLWDPKRLRYPWLDDLPALNRPFLLEDYREHCGVVQVERMVFLQCDCIASQFLDEVEWVTAVADGEPRIQGIVPFAPLEEGEEVRGALETLSQNPLVKGVRRLIQSEDVAFCVQPDFVRGVQLLAAYDLSFDICIKHPQLANTIRMVRQCPEVQFVLDHIGKPNIKNGLMEPWARELKELAGFPNVWCKMSGVMTEGDLDGWTREDLKPYIDQVISCFGFDRMMFGGDWPVATLAGRYPEWVEALSWALEGCTEEEKKKLFHDNAIDFYRLETREGKSKK
ncbi:MAG: amidohydrolase family protein [bacterium]|nr:amidohydrolase family protein [bacterium]